MPASVINVGRRLDKRRVRLGLSCAALAQQARLSLRTVQRFLSGDETDPALSTVVALARALGAELRFDEEDTNVLRHRQAARKADQLVALVQGNSALEAQGLSDDAIQDLRERTVRDLLAGSNRKLWAD